MMKWMMVAAIAMSAQAWAADVETAADASAATPSSQRRTETFNMLTRPGLKISPMCPIATVLTIDYIKKTAHLEMKKLTLPGSRPTDTICHVMVQPNPRDYKDLVESGPGACGAYKFVGTGMTRAGKTILTIVDSRKNTCVSRSPSDVTATEEAPNGGESHLYSAKQ